MATATKKVDYDSILDKWKKDVEDIVGKMEGWLKSHPSHPEVKSSPVTIHEKNFNDYSVIGLHASFQNEYPDHLQIMPGSRNFPYRGSILITSHSNLRRVFLLQSEEGDGWTIYTDSNLPIHLDLNEHDFHILIDDLRNEL